MVEDERVIAVNAAAARRGVTPGMRRNGVLAIAPGVLLLPRDPGREAAAVDSIAQAMLRYTPQVALAEHHAVLLDVTASLRMFGGPLALSRKVRRTLQALGHAGGLGMAPTADGAWLLAQARQGQRRVLRPARLAPVLDRLPWRALPEAQAHADWLADIGCRTLGGLRRLPRGSLQRRVGPALGRRLDQAYGRQASAWRWVEPPLRFDRKIELAERIDHAEAAWHAVERLVQPLCGWLAARQRALAAFAIHLHHERGRHARPASTLSLRLGEPASQPEHLVRLVRERLARLVLPAPVIAVQLADCETVPLDGQSAGLFREPGGTPSEHRRLLELLAARIGRERLQQPGVLADYRPERANTWEPAEFDPPQRPLPAAPRGERPFWLLAEPQPLAATGDRPLHAGAPLRLLQGPDRIEAAWWDGPLAARDYYIAEDHLHRRCWVYRERGPEPAPWFLQGWFA
ncbi:DNA polymerase Y family protein [Verticiella sediminum]|uniref:DNA polymerase Y family protein n=1 Tax=Verticiella sediminum TaxID=1247510 RepID=A0A556AFF4_9BURK|nr:DNA polymerase Y family protein [Verticiella sediminum]